MTATSILKRLSFSGAAVVLPLLLLDLPPLILARAARARAGTGPSVTGVLAADSCVGTRWRDASRDASTVSIGAIRWDAWFRGNIYERFLDPEEWQSRVPFYGTILSPSRVQVQSDSGVVMDEEIGFAAAAGLTYWAFNHYHPNAFPTAESFNYGLRLYLSSPCRDQINFSLILHGNFLGPTEWPSTVAMLVDLFQNPGYQRVEGGRPLLYFFNGEDMEHRMGSWARARAALDDLRAAALKAGLADPYLVGLASPPRQAAELADLLGFDAIGAYAAIGGGHGERSFDELRRANEAFWSDAVLTGKKVVPPVNVGWDPRPRLADPGLGHGAPSQVVWYRAPKPGELGEHLKRAVTWAAEQTAPAPRTVLVYAWNEHDEGGWLTPTLSEGTARVDAFAQALRELSPPTPTPDSPPLPE